MGPVILSLCSSSVSGEQLPPQRSAALVPPSQSPRDFGSGQKFSSLKVGYLRHFVALTENRTTCLSSH